MEFAVCADYFIIKNIEWIVLPTTTGHDIIERFSQQYTQFENEAYRIIVELDTIVVNDISIGNNILDRLKVKYDREQYSLRIPREYL